jgi:hypothetical protein
MGQTINTLKDTVTQNPDGFTANPETLALINPSKGYAVAVTNNKFNSINDIVFKENGLRNLALYFNAFIGGWFDGGVYYVDIVILTDSLEEAYNAARLFKQKAFYSFEANASIFV